MSGSSIHSAHTLRISLFTFRLTLLALNSNSLPHMIISMLDCSFWESSAFRRDSNSERSSSERLFQSRRSRFCWSMFYFVFSDSVFIRYSAHSACRHFHVKLFQDQERYFIRFLLTIMLFDKSNHARRVFPSHFLLWIYFGRFFSFLVFFYWVPALYF